MWIPDPDNPRRGWLGEMVGPMGAYFTTVRFTRLGHEIETIFENDEFEVLEDPLEYDDDDE